ncbi:MAG: hypothetical protein KIT72_00095 [Polyangiaceae bacterium]|nr:hypothetical protein [Polyangiaceae bacterium]MCW5788795.1 hypothetical protein [Polyangiaceae bacterium]
MAAIGLGLIPACGGDDGATQSGQSGGTSGNGGTSGSGGTSGTSGTSGGGTGGWAPTECSAGDVTDCYSGPPGTDIVGSCRPGVRTCQLGKYSDTCEGEVLPVEEICNGLDDDCDGEVDEGCSCTEGNTQACYSGPAGTQGVAACKSGIQTCQASGTWSPSCAGEVTPSVEVCNGIDDDCNGVIDDVSSVHLYRLQFPGLTWDSQLLSNAWTGPNAPPPCAEIATVFNAYDFNQLMVFTTTGQLYLREDSVWRAPVPATSRFQELPATLDAVYQLPWTWLGTPTPETQVTFSSSPIAYRYTYHGNGNTPLAELINQGPAHVRNRWAFERIDPPITPSTTGVLVHFVNDELHHMDMSVQVTSWPHPSSHPYFSQRGAPDATRCTAAWFDMPTQRAYFICP